MPGIPYVATTPSAKIAFSNTRKPVTWPSASRPVTHTKRPMRAMAKASGIAPRVGSALDATPLTGSMIT